MSALRLPDPGDDHCGDDSHGSTVAAGSSPAEAKQRATPIGVAPRLEDSLLLIYADALDDLERVRVATENRIYALENDKGMAGTPEVLRFRSVTVGLLALEHGAELELKRAVRRHPLGPWIKRTVGVGEKQGARLLAAIRDPATRRGPGQLWAYCGLDPEHPGQALGDAQPPRARVQQTSDASQEAQTPRAGVARRARRGQLANWNATAKMRVYLVAESCIKQRHSPYRKVYEDGRAQYAESVHQHPCPRCGPKGHPAAVGSPLSDGHKHARARRLVMKEILEDLWHEARRLEMET